MEKEEEAEQTITHMCLESDCKDAFLINADEDMDSKHKHTKTSIYKIEEVREKLKDAWEPKESMIQAYKKKQNEFYNNLKTQINKVIDDDQKLLENILAKLQYHHLPIQANSQVYFEFIREEYQRLDRISMLKLIEESESGSLNEDLSKQKQIADLLDL